jgi:hypothetical protein
VQAQVAPRRDQVLGGQQDAAVHEVVDVDAPDRSPAWPGRTSRACSRRITRITAYAVAVFCARTRAVGSPGGHGRRVVRGTAPAACVTGAV